MLGEGRCYCEGLCTIVCIVRFGIPTSRLKKSLRVLKANVGQGVP